MNKMDFNKPFKITVEHYDQKISFEYGHSDISFDDYMEALKSVTKVVFCEKLWNDYFEEVQNYHNLED